MGGSSARAIVGVTNAAQVQKNPTTTTKVLNARFIVFILLVRIPWERKPLLATNYKAHVKTGGRFLISSDWNPIACCWGAVPVDLDYPSGKPGFIDKRCNRTRMALFSK